MSFKIVRFICCGIDVHKDILVATIGTTDKSTLLTEYIQETFNTLNPDLRRLVSWLKEHNCKDVCMESTGKYWIPVWNVLEENGFNICLTNPKYVKAIKQQKTDKKDSKWICDLYKHDMPRCSFIPPKEIRELREIARYYRKLTNMSASESNRYQNCLTISNLGIGSVFRNVFGKSAQKVMNEILEAKEEEDIDDEKLLSLLHKNCKQKDKLIDAVKGAKLQSDARFKLKEIQEHREELEKHTEACLAEMYKRAFPLLPKFAHITSIPGISLTSAILIISEIGVDMNVWDDARQLTHWAGLTPGNNESANKKKSVRVTKGGTYLKPLLVQCALGAVRNSEGYFGIKYRRISKRRGHKRAIIAIARMMLVSIYHMILTGDDFKPTDYEELMNPSPKKNKELTVEKAIDFLTASGINQDDLLAMISQKQSALSATS